MIAEIVPYDSSERDLLMLHLDKVNKGDMLLLDRGYPCFWLLFLLQAKGIEFCVSLKEDWWLQVQHFTQSTDLERIVEFSLPKKTGKNSRNTLIWLTKKYYVVNKSRTGKR